MKSAKEWLLVFAYQLLYGLMMLFLLHCVLVRDRFFAECGIVALSLLKLIGRLTQFEDDGYTEDDDE